MPIPSCVAAAPLPEMLSIMLADRKQFVYVMKGMIKVCMPKVCRQPFWMRHSTSYPDSTFCCVQLTCTKAVQTGQERKKAVFGASVTREHMNALQIHSADTATRNQLWPSTYARMSGRKPRQRAHYITAKW